MIVEVDARGLYCPIPVLRLASALTGCPPGGRARLFASDPDAVADVEAFCRETGAILISRREQENVFIFEVEKGLRAE